MSDPSNEGAKMIKDTPAIRISLVASESMWPALGDVALFIYDFDSLYEVSRLAIDPKYENFKFSRFALYRNGRPLKPEDRMHIQILRLESPLELVTTILAASAAASSVLMTLWLAIQLIEKISNFGLTRRKLALEIRKLERDLGLGENGNPTPPTQDPIEAFSRRDAVPYIDALTKRLAKSPVVVKEVRFDVIQIPKHQQSDTD